MNEKPDYPQDDRPQPREALSTPNQKASITKKPDYPQDDRPQPREALRNPVTIGADYRMRGDRPGGEESPSPPGVYGFGPPLNLGRVVFSDPIMPSPDEGSHGQVRVHFSNSYRTTVQVVIVRYDPSTCGGRYGKWATAGWYTIEPKQRVWVFETDRRFACYYAEAIDGTRWFGYYGPIYVYQQAFESCVSIGSTAAYGMVGPMLIDLDTWPGGVNLLPRTD
jgi:hypothetical protein